MGATDPLVAGRARGGARVAVAAAVVGLVAACGGDRSPSGPGDPGPSGGAIEVAVSTNGDAPDPDGYEVVVDGSRRAAVGTDGSVRVDGLSEGEYEVRLAGLAPNCVTGSVNGRLARVSAGGTARIEFAVRCPAQGFSLTVNPGVDSTAVRRIEDGLAIAQTFLVDSVGGDLSEAAREVLTITVESDPGGRGARTTFSADSIFITFNVGLSSWGGGGPWSTEVNQEETVVHEYAHALQVHTGCMELDRDRETPVWFLEGAANYVSYRAMADRGAMTVSGVHGFMLEAARSDGELQHPLEAYEDPDPDDLPWPWHVGYLAVEMLVERAPEGAASVRTVCRRRLEERLAGAADSAAFSRAFERTFGTTLAAFYDDFEEWRQDRVGS